MKLFPRHLGALPGVTVEATSPALIEGSRAVVTGRIRGRMLECGGELQFQSR
jgi:hypothetical protein